MRRKIDEIQRGKIDSYWFAVDSKDRESTKITMKSDRGRGFANIRAGYIRVKPIMFTI